MDSHPPHSHPYTFESVSSLLSKSLGSPSEAPPNLLSPTTEKQFQTSTTPIVRGLQKKFVWPARDYQKGVAALQTHVSRANNVAARIKLPAEKKRLPASRRMTERGNIHERAGACIETTRVVLKLFMKLDARVLDEFVSRNCLLL